MKSNIEKWAREYTLKEDYEYAPEPDWDDLSNIPDSWCEGYQEDGYTVPSMMHINYEGDKVIGTDFKYRKWVWVKQGEDYRWIPYDE